jgi:lipoyl(octanoyl) transferase
MPLPRTAMPKNQMTHPAETVAAQRSHGIEPPKPLVIRHLGLMPYAETFAAMRAFTLARDAHTPDEIWLTEHPPVYTLGLAGKREHILNAGAIPQLQSDRGGQVTYHGPGQVIAYLLIDLRRRDLKVRELVRLIEEALIATLRRFGVAGVRRAGMPGVYVESGAKIAALGLKVKNGCTYHGASLNVDMDLAPFRGINPCGYERLAVTQLADFNRTVNADAAALALASALRGALSQS